MTARANGWDPASGSGVTATFGALARAVATNKGLMSDAFAEPMVRAIGLEYFVRVIDDDVFSDDGGDNPAMLGLIDVLAAHTRFVDEYLAGEN